MNSYIYADGVEPGRLIPYNVIGKFRSKCKSTTSAQRWARECARYNPWAVACLFLEITMPKTSIFLIARPARMLLAALGIVAITGCATNYPSGSASQQPRYVLNNDAAKPILDENINGFLSQAPAGGIVSAATSPWGDNIEIVADEPYMAASGRECRRLQIIAMGGEAQRALVCKVSEDWVNQRVITQTAEGRL